MDDIKELANSYQQLREHDLNAVVSNGIDLSHVDLLDGRWRQLSDVEMRDRRTHLPAHRGHRGNRQDAMQEVQHLAGLSPRAEQRIVAPRAFLRFVESDRTSFDAAFGRLHRTIKVERDAR